MKNLTKDEVQLLIESLVFTSCTDICRNNTIDGRNSKMVELVKKLSKEFKINTLQEMYVYGDNNYEDPEIVNQYTKIFKDLVESDFIE